MKRKSLDCASEEAEDCDALVATQGKKRAMTIDGTTHEMSRAAHFHYSVMNDPVSDDKLALCLKHGNFRSALSRSAVHNCANLVVENDHSIRIVSMSSAQLKSQSRVIENESECTLSS